MRKNKNDGLSPAALVAILNGDMGNAMAAMLPGGIERQEAAGQQALVAHKDRLPVVGTVKDRPYGCGDRDLRAEWESVGFVFGETLTGQDSIFVACTFPDGWALRPTGHSVWSDVVDAKGRKRAAVFFKAAFYDYNAHTFGLEFRYTVGGDYLTNDASDRRMAYYVKDAVTGDRLCEFKDEQPLKTFEGSAARRQAEAWLADRFPDYKNPLAYWD
jgi:hypothetical protein